MEILNRQLRLLRSFFQNILAEMDALTNIFLKLEFSYIKMRCNVARYGFLDSFCCF